MAVTITLDDHVAKSVERALTAALPGAHSLRLDDPDFARDLAIALDVLAPAIVEAEGREAWRRALTQVVAVAYDVERYFPDPHAPNAHDAVDDGFGNDGE